MPDTEKMGEVRDVKGKGGLVLIIIDKIHFWRQTDTNTYRVNSLLKM